MRIPMPSPNGTNREQKFIDASLLRAPMALDAAPRRRLARDDDPEPEKFHRMDGINARESGGGGGGKWEPKLRSHLEGEGFSTEQIDEVCRLIRAAEGATDEGNGEMGNKDEPGGWKDKMRAFLRDRNIAEDDISRRSKLVYLAVVSVQAQNSPVMFAAAHDRRGLRTTLRSARHAAIRAGTEFCRHGPPKSNVSVWMARARAAHRRLCA